MGPCNVGSLNRAGRLENLKKEMDRLMLDIVGISEVRWQEEQDVWSGDYRVINTKSNRGNAGSECWEWWFPSNKITLNGRTNIAVIKRNLPAEREQTCTTVFAAH
ncbi:uncharacterized protein LOC126108802 [Schistocerca cancellata]|uniref:uncharacterized protein LOC126108802 n=1 Tax=Schistocerca cancellata TaxID=274614 RepID=UPI0021191FED|nr:uncharacterized protein LOC126108802 [Schistocerca cancellata]